MRKQNSVQPPITLTTLPGTDPIPSTQSLPQWVRLRVTGRDRAKFLHNFCTNNVKALSEGTACEAFFTDVKARIIAHGYVIALEDRHEIWLLAGTEADLQKHLTRYIITDDVAVTMPAAQKFAVTVSGLESVGVVDRLCSGDHASSFAALRAVSLTNILTAADDVRACGLMINWAGHGLTVFAGDEETISVLCERFSSLGVELVTGSELNHLRIEERFPVIGRDLTSEHLAPEAERNGTAISYNKGCYLGQEPIARLDAMGHVNRALRKTEIRGPVGVVAGSSLQSPNGVVVGSLTSVTAISEGLCRGLAVVRLAALKDQLVAVTDSGETFPASVIRV